MLQIQRLISSYRFSDLVIGGLRVQQAVSFPDGVGSKRRPEFSRLQATQQRSRQIQMTKNI